MRPWASRCRPIEARSRSSYGVIARVCQPRAAPGPPVTSAIVLGRYLDDSYAPEVRRNITTVALSRLGANAVYRFSAPFLPTIASGLDVSLSRLGAAIAISEAVGLTAPLVGRHIDRRHHPTTMALGLVGVTAGALVAAAGPNIVWFVVGLVLLAVTPTRPSAIVVG